MKTLVFANQKGGVGKSALAVQFAYYLSEILKKRVLVIDFDHQRNTTKAISKSNLARTANITSSLVLSSKINNFKKESDFCLIPGDDFLLKMEKQASEHNTFATNLFTFLSSVDNEFDVCIVDTNPNPDIRQLASLVVCDYVLSPIQLNQEAIDGIGDLLNHENIGIRRIQSTINKKLELIGILPNIVEPTPFQRDNMRDLAAAFAKLLIPLNQGFAAIKKTTAIPEAQAAGVPLWKINKSSAREAWVHIKPVFSAVATKMGQVEGK